MENLVSSVTREVAQFKRYNAESMAVVLKPDAHTEIFLHLVSRNGSVEMQARFERGDFQALNGHWSQLQQSLSQNGVRLGALQEGFHPPSGNPSSANAQWGHGQLPGQQHQPGSRDGQEPAPAQSFHEEQPPAKTPSPTRLGAVVRRTTRRVALEAWA